MKSCTITAIFPDGERYTMTGEAATLHRAVIAYVVEAACGNGVRPRKPEPGTVFEVTPDGGRTRRVTWEQNRAWVREQMARNEPILSREAARR